MLKYQYWECKEFEIKVKDINQVCDISFIKLRVYETYGTYGKWSRQCLWNLEKNTLIKTTQTTEKCWVLDMSEIGEASVIRKKREKA